MNYYLNVNLHERGLYNADVIDENDNIIFEINTELAKELVDYGYLQYIPHQDLNGLKKYLIDMDVIPKNSIIYSSEDEMYNNIKESISQITRKVLLEDYKFASDEDIESSYSGVKLISLVKGRDMSYMYPKNTFEFDAIFDFPNSDEIDETNSETYEDIVVNLDNKEYEFTTNNWYPSKVYSQMQRQIDKELSKQFGGDFQYLTDSQWLDHYYTR